MRIISGSFKGKKILEPKDKKTRPLKDLTKESIFNIIIHSNKFKINFANSYILDLFSGVGSFGIECLSRGVKKVIFIENYQGVIPLLKKNLFGWHVILQQQGYQDPHIHPAGWLSGVIYLKVVPSLEKNEGAIEFSLNAQNYSDVKSPKFIHQPKKGDIVFFPSSLHHRTIPFTTNTDRIIISFYHLPLRFYTCHPPAFLYIVCL